MRIRRRLEFYAGRIAANGTIEQASGDFAVIRLSVGSYSVQFPKGFKPIASVVGIRGAPSIYANYGTLMASGIGNLSLQTQTTAGVNTDARFEFITVGYAG